MYKLHYCYSIFLHNNSEGHTNLRSSVLFVLYIWRVHSRLACLKQLISFWQARQDEEEFNLDLTFYMVCIHPESIYRRYFPVRNLTPLNSSSLASTRGEPDLRLLLWAPHGAAEVSGQSSSVGLWSWRRAGQSVFVGAPATDHSTGDCHTRWEGLLCYVNSLMLTMTLKGERILYGCGCLIYWMNGITYRHMESDPWPRRGWGSLQCDGHHEQLNGHTDWCAFWRRVALWRAEQHVFRNIQGFCGVLNMLFVSLIYWSLPHGASSTKKYVFYAYKHTQICHTHTPSKCVLFYFFSYHTSYGYAITLLHSDLFLSLIPL